MLRLGRDAAGLRQVGPLRVEVVEGVGMLLQVVQLGLGEDGLLEVLLICAHIKSARIKAELVA